MRRILLTTVVGLLHVGTAVADDDAASGAVWAEKWCSGCHDVGPKGAAQSHPPSFASIARFRSPEQIRLRILNPPIHSEMPEMMAFLTPEHTDGLVAYIQSLE